MNSTLGFFGSAAPNGVVASRTAPTASASASTLIPQNVCFMEAILEEISGLSNVRGELIPSDHCCVVVFAVALALRGGAGFHRASMLPAFHS